MTLQHIIEDKKNEVRDLCRSMGVRQMYVFGSAVNGPFSETSDIDLLISFSDDLTIEEYTNNYFTLHYRLRVLFNRDVDIVTAPTLSNPYFIESINHSKVLLYKA